MYVFTALYIDSSQIQKKMENKLKKSKILKKIFKHLKLINKLKVSL